MHRHAPGPRCPPRPTQRRRVRPADRCTPRFTHVAVAIGSNASVCLGLGEKTPVRSVGRSLRRACQSRDGRFLSSGIHGPLGIGAESAAAADVAPGSGQRRGTRRARPGDGDFTVAGAHGRAPSIPHTRVCVCTRPRVCITRAR